MSADKTPSRQASKIGGLRAAANMTPEERSERSRKAAEAKWRKENERRAAEGLPPTKKRDPEPSAAELEEYLEEVDRRWPDRQWENREARRRQAIILARIDIAEAVEKTLRKGSTS